jgi:hypothetical protein
MYRRDRPNAQPARDACIQDIGAISVSVDNARLQLGAYPPYDRAFFAKATRPDAHQMRRNGLPSESLDELRARSRRIDDGENGRRVTRGALAAREQADHGLEPTIAPGR